MFNLQVKNSDLRDEHYVIAARLVKENNYTVLHCLDKRLKKVSLQNQNWSMTLTLKFSGRLTQQVLLDLLDIAIYNYRRGYNKGVETQQAAIRKALGMPLL